jgi:YHS domain-containing protein
MSAKLHLALAALVSAVSPVWAQPANVPPAPPTAAAPADDGVDPNVKRDVSQYNLDKAGLAIQGYDPVSYFSEGGEKPAQGKKNLEYRYRGATYRFATQANLDAFKKNPRKYEPAHGGWCSSAMADGGRKVEIDPKAFKLTKGRLFLFYTNLITDARSFWNKDEPKNTRDADAHWKKLSGEDPRLAEQPPAPGSH